MMRYVSSDCSHDSQAENCHKVKQLLTQHWAKVSLWHGMVVKETTLHIYTRLQRPRQDTGAALWSAPGAGTETRELRFCQIKQL